MLVTRLNYIRYRHHVALMHRLLRILFLANNLYGTTPEHYYSVLVKRISQALDNSRRSEQLVLIEVPDVGTFHHPPEQHEFPTEDLPPTAYSAHHCDHPSHHHVEGSVCCEVASRACGCRSSELPSCTKDSLWHCRLPTLLGRYCDWGNGSPALQRPFWGMANAGLHQPGACALCPCNMHIHIGAAGKAQVPREKGPCGKMGRGGCTLGRLWLFTSYHRRGTVGGAVAGVGNGLHDVPATFTMLSGINAVRLRSGVIMVLKRPSSM